MSEIKNYTIPEAAELLRINTHTLYKKCQSKLGPKTFKIGVKVLITKEDLEAYIEQQKT